MKTRIIGHRGSPGHLPDHTLEGYRLAIEQGAVDIEPDLVPTRDGVLVARHENDISATTDVSEKFPDRRRTAVVDGQPLDGWFVEDLTWAELSTLRARQPMPGRSHAFDGLYAIPRLEQILALADEEGRRRGEPVGVVPELKHPSYFRSLGLPVEATFVDVMKRGGRADVGAVVQCFELPVLEALAPDLGVPRLWLVGDLDDPPLPGNPPTRDALADLVALRRKVEAIGVPRSLVVGEGGEADLITRAHAAGLLVYVYTFRTDTAASLSAYDAEVRRFVELGADGLFADQPDAAARVLSEP